jgi:hypothetical protein
MAINGTRGDFVIGGDYPGHASKLPKINISILDKTYRFLIFGAI